jgi:crossover junction endodeoxyribonuclease RuvC
MFLRNQGTWLTRIRGGENWPEKMFFWLKLPGFKPPKIPLNIVALPYSDLCGAIFSKRGLTDVRTAETLASNSIRHESSAMLQQLTRIAGLDPGLCNLGWGIVDWDGARLSYVACGTIKTNTGDPMGSRLAALFAGLEDVLERWAPAEAAVEETFVNGNARSALKLGQARGIALLVPARMGLSVAEYAPNAVKKTVTGTGHADKVQIRAMIRYLLPKATPKTADAADALAIAVTHAHHRRARMLAAEHAARAGTAVLRAT